MTLSERDIRFIETHSAAAMITLGRDGRPKAARVGVALFEGNLWSSGTQDRVRTKRLRDDPRCTLYIHDAEFAWLALETTVAILDGPDAPEQSLRLFRHTQKKPTGALSWFGGELEEEDFLQKMRDERRLIYEFDVHRAYGLHFS